jgi:signal transduction histidine kinase
VQAHGSGRCFVCFFSVLLAVALAVVVGVVHEWAADAVGLVGRAHVVEPGVRGAGGAGRGGGDVLAVEQAKQDADRANRAKSEFLSSKSHEPRTPLNAILGFGQLLQLDDLTQEQTESVDHILRGGRHLLELINEVLDISRIVSGNLSLSPEPVDALEVVRDPGRP